MLTLFNRPITGLLGGLYSPELERLLTLHRENTTRTQAYYRQQSFATASNHPLVRLIEQFPAPSYPLDLIHYQERVEANMQRLAQHFRWCTPTTVGRSQVPGLLFDERSEELMIAHHQPRSLIEFDTDWAQWAPLRYLSHSRTTLALPFPHGKHAIQTHAVSVILIDIPLLACQYACWFQQQRRAEYARTPMQFLINYPLNNALPSFQDVAFLNQLLAIVLDQPFEHEPAQHPFYLNAYESRTEEVYRDLVYAYQRKHRSFTTLLNTFPAIHQPTLQAVMAIPPMPMTHPLWWPLTIARLWVSAGCLQWGVERSHAADREALNDIRYRIKTLQGHRQLASLLSDEGETWVQRQLARVESLI
jgi:hypothetical protein